jgi:RsiW-degrading membrane proteinase PrsW (M82 family)
MMEWDINWVAVIVATIAHQALGALWYAVLFRDVWLREMGMNPEEIENQSPGGEMLYGAVASFLSVTSLALILANVDNPEIGDGILWGAVAGIGFVTAATVMNGVYEQKKPIVTAIFGGYYTLGLMIAGAILGAWN